MKKPLLIAHNYLFNSSASGIIERSMFEYLQGKGFDTTVVCSRKSDMTPEQSLCRIIQPFDNQLVRLFVALLKRVVATDFSFIPDYVWFSWGHHAVRKTCQYLKKNECSYIHSIGIPHSTHLIAYQVKQKYNIPWVAQFYDPWACNPYRTFKTAFLERYDAGKEALVAYSADIIIHDNQVIADFWARKYGNEVARKIRVLSLLFDDHGLKLPAEACPGIKKRTIAHIGNFYPQRTSETFIYGVEEFMNIHPECRESLRVVYVGHVTQNERHLIETLGLGDVFELTGTLRASECERYYLESDVFLSIDANLGLNYFFPSKIMKYFYYRKPILGLTPRDSVLDYELTHSGNCSIRNDDVSGVSSYIGRVLFDYGSLLDTIDKTYWEKFTVEAVTERYMTIVDELTNK